MWREAKGSLSDVIQGGPGGAQGLAPSLDSLPSFAYTYKDQHSWGLERRCWGRWTEACGPGAGAGVFPHVPSPPPPSRCVGCALVLRPGAGRLAPSPRWWHLRVRHCIAQCVQGWGPSPHSAPCGQSTDVRPPRPGSFQNPQEISEEAHLRGVHSLQSMWSLKPQVRSNQGQQSPGGDTSLQRSQESPRIAVYCVPGNGHQHM